MNQIRANKMKGFLSAALTLMLLHAAAAIKIGVSRANQENTSTTSATTTTTTQQPHETNTESTPSTAAAITTLTEESTVITDITDLDIESSTTTTTKNPIPTTLKPNFTIAIFPPRLRTTKAPRITTTTAAASTTPPTTVSSTIANTTLDSNNVQGTPLTVPPSHAASYYCDCDLLWDACDLNCCCDRDCSPEALHVFNCNAAPKQPELKNRLEDFQYQHGLPSCKVNDGWLCVFRTNTRQELQKEPAIDFNTDHYLKWSTPVWDIDSEPQANANFDHYIYGEPLQFLDMKTKIVKEFDLPHTFKQPHCHIKEPVKFLNSHKLTCLLSTTDELNLNTRKLLIFIQNHKLLLKPIKEANEPEQLPPILSELKLNICQEELCESVSPINNTACELKLKHFYATEIKLKLLHNYTQILDGLLELRGQRESLDLTEVWQKYQVEYIYRNASGKPVVNDTAYTHENVPKLTSGPLGYQAGKPIIIARFIANNRSEALTPTNQIIDYFHVNSTKSQTNHTISLFTTQRQYCTRDTDPANLINYGISTLKQCKLRFSNESLAKLPQAERNFTEICIQMQTQILAQFFNADVFRFGEKFPDLHISQLGRPQNRSDKWTLLQVRNHELFAPVSGDFHTQTQSFSCRNMLLNIGYEFLVGHFTAAGIRQQALVKRATLTFGDRNDLEFELDEVIEVPLMLSVMFFDYAKDAINAAILRNEAQAKWTIIILNLVILCVVYIN
ncbi:tectonic [Rhagoletis pomonella]|uniref:tectonic n=1 Tax=Rhagoletis pomonella TaxID=28610 RepID=UPI00178632FE|nr:tectonic [Rhagoletis pomonella]